MHYLEIHHIDVGQGDCTVILVKDAGGLLIRTAVIDCGGGKNGIDDGSAGIKLSTFLIQRNIYHIDVFVITHYESDHFGGINALLKLAEGGRSYRDNAGQSRTYRSLFQNTIFWDRGEPGTYQSTLKQFKLSFTNSSYGYYVNRLKHTRGDNDDFDTSLRRITEIGYGSFKRYTDDALNFSLISTKFLGRVNAEYKAKNFQFKAPWALIGIDIMNRFLEDIPIKLECIAVNQFTKNTDDEIIRIEGLNDYDENDYSVVLLLSFGNFHYYLGGELPSVGERTILPYIQKKTGTYGLTGMKASHHGSSSATDPSFIDALEPQYVTISCGPGNKHKHPSKDIMDLLESRDYIQSVLLTGYGGPQDDPRNPTYYSPYLATSKFQFAGSDSNNQPGNIGVFTDTTHATTPECWAECYNQNYLLQWNPQPGQEDFWGGDDFLAMSSLIDMDGNSAYWFVEFDTTIGIGRVYIPNWKPKTLVGTLTVVGDFITI